ncbi:MAG: hypothetical protein ACE5H9_04180 [Anaerolineae bacterium]
MSSPNLQPNDDLDRLLRKTLHDRVGNQNPPQRIWPQIKRRLQESGPVPRRPRLAWRSLVAQTAVAVVLALFGGITLQSLMFPGNKPYLATRPRPSSVAMIFVEDAATSPQAATLSDEVILRSMKNQTQLPFRSNYPAAATGPADEKPILLDETDLRSMKTAGNAPLAGQTSSRQAATHTTLQLFEK